MNDIVIKGKQYKQYGFNNVGVDLMRQMVKTQKSANKSNEIKNIAIIQDAMRRLLE